MVIGMHRCVCVGGGERRNLSGSLGLCNATAAHIEKNSFTIKHSFTEHLWLIQQLPMVRLDGTLHPEKKAPTASSSSSYQMCQKNYHFCFHIKQILNQ